MKLKQILPLMLLLGGCAHSRPDVTTAQWEVIGGERTTFTPDTILSVPVAYRGFWQFDSDGEGRYSYGAEGLFLEGAFYWKPGENVSWWMDIGPHKARLAGAWLEDTGRMHLFILRVDGPAEGSQWQEDLFLEPSKHQFKHNG